MRTFKIYFFSSFQLYSTVMLTIVTILTLDSQTYSTYNWKFVPLDQSLVISPTPQTLATANLPSVSMSLDSTYKWERTVFVFLYLTYFTHHNALKVHPCCHKGQDFLLFYDWIIFIFIYIFWLHLVFVAACRLSLVVASRGYSSLRCVGFSLWWLLLLWSMGSRHMGFSTCGTWAP